MHKRVLFYVQHLLGIGHLKRVSIIVKQMSLKGLDVTVISGGNRVDSIDFGKASFIQLPSAKAKDSNFSTLIDENGNTINDIWKKNRRELVLNVFQKLEPHILITEMFPFGRNQMKFELLPLLEEANNSNVTIISSIRDIIVSDIKKTKVEQRNFLLTKYYKYILVHGEEKYYSIGKNLGLDKLNIKKIYYTGYVCNQKNNKNSLPRYKKEILVSAGGGAVGKKIIVNAIKASSLFFDQDFTWRILIGLNENDQNKKEYSKLAHQTGKKIIIEYFTENFNILLSNCLVSISQAGYNTFLEAISCKVKSIFIPYAEDIKSDQIIRARSFSSLNFIKYIDEKDLNPSKIKDSIIELMKQEDREFNLPNFDGAENTYKFINGLTNE
ncbi:MAG: hypothetical protein CMM18_05365 [Rhodospirillaceae bacterium]|nr:hypothetical protein [Rhodospirillaceae bacterium]